MTSPTLTLSIISEIGLINSKSILHNYFKFQIRNAAKDVYKILVGNKCDDEENREVTYEMWKIVSKI
jgi:hypothetical protein